MICINLYSFLIFFLAISALITGHVLYRKKRKLRKKLKKQQDLSKNENSHEQDNFHSGKFHFEQFIDTDIINNIKYALAKNDQDALYKFLKQIDGANDEHKIKTKKISDGDVITIGFFCNYMNSGIFRNTIGGYNNFFDKIKWVGCHIAPNHVITGSSCPIISFSDTKSAIQYADKNFDFVIDADFLLRPNNFYEILKNTSCHTLNYYNFSCSSYNSHLDAFLVVDGLEVSKYTPSEKIITLPAQGSWKLDEQKEFHPTYLYDITLIGDQFKYGEKFLEMYKSFSYEFKILFLGLRDP